MNPQPAKNKEHPWNSPASVRLLIAGDQPRVRQSLEALLTAQRWSTPDRSEIQIEIVGEANDGQQAVAQVEALNPDVIVLDLPTHDSNNRVFIPGSKLDGLAAIRTIKVRWPSVRIVVLTMYATDRSAVLLAGADVFLLKGCTTNDLLEAMAPAVS
jgi:DNA-binding NarL/FixJ family response regulator